MYLHFLALPSCLPMRSDTTVPQSCSPDFLCIRSPQYMCRSGHRNTLLLTRSAELMLSVVLFSSQILAPLKRSRLSASRTAATLVAIPINIQWSMRRHPHTQFHDSCSIAGHPALLNFKGCNSWYSASFTAQLGC